MASSESSCWFVSRQRLLRGTSGGRSHGRSRGNNARVGGRMTLGCRCQVGMCFNIWKRRRSCMLNQCRSRSICRCRCTRQDGLRQAGAVQSCWFDCERIISTCFSMWHLQTAPPCEMLNWTWDDCTGSIGGQNEVVAGMVRVVGESSLRKV